ncbi:hypothetical protein B0H12DRAFT_1230628 [Mycena haematopus]|nr:hypothetical protein B0H12DRAFT_1230628 [Mycena haematopus]
MFQQHSNSHPAQLAALQTIAPKTEAFKAGIENPNKRKRDNSTSEELPKAKKPYRSKSAWCPLCHRGFTETKSRNNHMGIEICMRIAIRRGLIPESTKQKEWEILVAAQKKSFSSNKLVHLQESSERFELAEKTGWAITSATTPAPFVGSSNGGVASSSSYGNVRGLDATAASATNPTPAPSGGSSSEGGPSSGSYGNVRGPDAIVAYNSEMVFHHQHPQARRSPAIPLASARAVDAGGRLNKQPSQLVGPQKSASNATLSQDQQYRSAVEKILTEPIPIIHRSPPIPQPAQKDPRLQAAASSGDHDRSSGPHGQLAFSIHELSPQSIPGGNGEFAAASPAYYASQPPSQLAGPSRSSSSGNVYARNGKAPQVAYPSQAEYAPNPYMREDVSGQFYGIQSSTPPPFNQYVRPSTSAQTSEMGPSQPLYLESPHTQAAPDQSGNAASASEAYYPPEECAMPTPMDDTWSVSGCPSNGQTFHPAQAHPVEPHAESYRNDCSAAFASLLCTLAESQTFSLNEVFGEGAYNMPQDAVEAPESGLGEQSLEELFSSVYGTAMLWEAQTSAHSTGFPSKTEKDEDAAADPELEEPVSLDEAWDILQAMAEGTYQYSRTYQWARTEASPSMDSTVGPDTPPDEL